MHLRNGVWTKGPPPKQAPAGPKVIRHRSQRTAIPSSGRRLDALLEGKARICILRCLAPETKILMSDGSLKPIIDIEPGDSVINMKGNPTKVLTKTYSGQAEKLIKFRSDRMLDPIVCTPEHKFFVLDLREKDFPSNSRIDSYLKNNDIKDLVKWVPAGELNEKTFLLRPSEIQLELQKPEPIDLAFYSTDTGTSKITDDYIISVGRNHETSIQEIADKTGGSYWQVAEVSRGRVKFTKQIHYKIKEELDKRDYHTKTKRFFPIGYDLGKFFGIILGDGSHRLRYKNGTTSSGEISIAVNSDYPEHIKEIERLVDSLFGLKTSAYRNKNQTTKCVQIIFYSIPIAKMLHKFNKKEKKQLPSEFLFDNQEYFQGLLDGLIQTDGHINKKGDSTFSNTSPFLANLCYWLYSKLNKNPKIYYIKQKSSVLKDGRVIKPNHNLFTIRPSSNKNKNNFCTISYKEVSYDISKIKEIEILEDQNQDVWDIGVKEEESFIAENVPTHNSLGGLGDIIMMTPIARGAKRKFPNCHVTYAIPIDYGSGDGGAVLENIPYIDEVIDYPLINRDDYDSYTNLTRVGLSDEKPYTVPHNRIDLFAQAAGIPLFGNAVPIYMMTEEERQWGKEFVKKAIRGRKHKGLISIHLGSRDPKRSWPHHRIMEFVNLARENGYFCFLYEWGATANEWTLAGSQQVFDYRMRQAAAVMEATDILVCPDSSLLHLAGAMNMKIVSLFGSMPPACRINHYANAIAVVNQQISCLGCVYSTCTNRYYCMSSILPQSVLQAVETQLKKKHVEPLGNDDNQMVYPGMSIKKNINTFAM
jgi:ADP-heptose:LPS heptosyltransferase/intein/homing endonuclease